MQKGLATFAGVTILAACACGTSAGLASVGGLVGLGAPSGIYYAGILVIGAALFGLGIAHKREAWLPGGLFLLSLLMAGLLAPPRVMSDSVTHDGSHILGFLFYMAALGALVWAVLRLYSVKANWPVVLGLSSVALAIGCTCCLTPGAVRYTSLWAGLHPSWLVSRFSLVALGAVLGSWGFYKLDQERWLPYFWGGILVAYPVEKLAEVLVPSWQAGEASLTFLIRYPLFLIGTGLIVFAASRLIVEQREIVTKSEIGNPKPETAAP